MGRAINAVSDVDNDYVNQYGKFNLLHDKICIIRKNICQSLLQTGELHTSDLQILMYDVLIGPK